MNFSPRRTATPPWTQVSQNKEKHLNMLTQVIVHGNTAGLKHHGVINALDAVLSIPAIRDRILLGNWHKIPRLACLEPVAHYL